MQNDRNDVISRQAAIKHLKKRLIETAINNIGVISRCDSIFEDTADNRIGPWLNELPSAQPERKRGRWNCSDDMYESAVCSVCGWDTTEPWDHIRHWFNYCPHCGADMREVDE